MSWYLQVLRKYADFSGRARRKEIWMFLLIDLLISGVLYSSGRDMGLVFGPTGLLDGFYDLAVLIPTFAVTVRRLHDIGKSGWWWFILFVPLIGAIVLFVFLITDSEPRANQYGSNPKAIAS